MTSYLWPACPQMMMVSFIIMQQSIVYADPTANAGLCLINVGEICDWKTRFQYGPHCYLQMQWHRALVCAGPVVVTVSTSNLDNGIDQENVVSAVIHRQVLISTSCLLLVQLRIAACNYFKTGGQLLVWIGVVMGIEHKGQTDRRSLFCFYHPMIDLFGEFKTTTAAFLHLSSRQWFLPFSKSTPPLPRPNLYSIRRISGNVNNDFVWFGAARRQKVPKYNPASPRAPWLSSVMNWRHKWFGEITQNFLKVHAICFKRVKQVFL